MGVSSELAFRRLGKSPLIKGGVRLLPFNFSPLAARVVAGFLCSHVLIDQDQYMRPPPLDQLKDYGLAEKKRQARPR